MSVNTKVTVPVGRPVVRIWAKDLYPADEVVNGRSKAEGIGNSVVLAALTGLRQGELFALRDRHIDLEALTVRVDHGAYQGDLVPVKTRASRRRVDLSSTAARILRRQLLARKPNELGLVRPSPRKLTGLRFHDLRHTRALPACTGLSWSRLLIRRPGLLEPLDGEAFFGTIRSRRLDSRQRATTGDYHRVQQWIIQLHRLDLWLREHQGLHRAGFQRDWSISRAEACLTPCWALPFGRTIERKLVSLFRKLKKIGVAEAVERGGCGDRTSACRRRMNR